MAEEERGWRSHATTERGGHGGERFTQDWPDDILEPPGLVGEVVRFIREASGAEQPKFALAAGLTFCGALIGRGVKDFTGQRTNLYTLAIGGTSAGKNDPIRAIGRLVESLSVSKFIAGEVTSDSALEILIEAFPVRLLLLDEIGQYLGTVKCNAANGHLRTAIPALTKCWSCAGGAFVGKARARDANGGWKPPKQIVEPCVALYGTSAPEVLFDSLCDGDFSDGSIPRFVPFISESRPMFTAKPEIAVPFDLSRRLREALLLLRIPSHGTKDDDGKAADVPTAQLVGETSEATSTFAALEAIKHLRLCEADAGDAVLYLYGKIVENARRIALIVAALRNPEKPLVEQSDAHYACSLMRLAVADMVAAARERVAGSAAERHKNKIRLLIRKRGVDGLTKSQLTRMTQSLRPVERDEALFDLVEAGDIIEREEAGKGTKPVTRYFFADAMR